MNTSKKCPYCDQWGNVGNNSCPSCGKPWINEQQERNEKRKQLVFSQPPVLIQIHPEDGLILRVFKYTIRLAQIILFAIVSFIIWVTAATPL